MPVVGVLALQGDFREHLASLTDCGVEGLAVRTPAQVDDVDALIIPGGESTTIGTLAERFGLVKPLQARIEAGMPVFGTCAGMILLSAGVTEGDQVLLGALDVVVERNAFGRQNESFEADLEITGLDRPFPGVFIRAPWVAKVGAPVEVLATIAQHPVMVRQGVILATSFHPELTGDRRIHQMLVNQL
ncbi:MAG: pyridoxal 5'-phosphate synthase glutaminase subunit PdxT [Actinomycetota bacterium]